MQPTFTHNCFFSCFFPFICAEPNVFTHVSRVLLPGVFECLQALAGPSHHSNLIALPPATPNTRSIFEKPGCTTHVAVAIFGRFDVWATASTTTVLRPGPGLTPSRSASPALPSLCSGSLLGEGGAALLRNLKEPVRSGRMLACCSASMALTCEGGAGKLRGN